MTIVPPAVKGSRVVGYLKGCWTAVVRCK